MNNCTRAPFLVRRARGGQAGVFVFPHPVLIFYSHADWVDWQALCAYPAPSRERILPPWIGDQRCIYKAKVSEDRYYRTFAKKAVSLSGMPVPVDQEYARFIGPDAPWLRNVPSQILYNGAVRWKQALARFFSGLLKRLVFQRKDGRQSVRIPSERLSFRYNHQSYESELV